MNNKQSIDYNKTTIELSTLLNALSHPARLQIIMHLAKYNGCQAGSISKRLPLAKSTVSEHLSKLKEVGLISCTSDGVCQNYQLNDNVFSLLKMQLFDFINQIDDRKSKRVGCYPTNQFENEKNLSLKNNNKKNGK